MKDVFGDCQPYLASTVPGSIPLFYLLLLLLSLLLGGGLCEVLGLAELLGGLRHGAALVLLLLLLLSPLLQPFCRLGSHQSAQFPLPVSLSPEPRHLHPLL